MLKIGDKAPDFTLLDGDENSVSLFDQYCLTIWYIFVKIYYIKPWINFIKY